MRALTTTARNTAFGRSWNVNQTQIKCFGIKPIVGHRGEDGVLETIYMENYEAK